MHTQDQASAMVTAGRRFQIRGAALTSLLCALDLFLSVFPRIPFLSHASSWWRSSQTLLTSFWFQKDGIQLLHYQTPLLGYPWEVPFEFPLYQAMSTLFSNLSGLDLTLASRLTALVIFYASAVLLFLLCLEILRDKPLAFIILTVYLWLPYSISYSTEILIDYLSLAFALGYVYWLKKWLDRPQNPVLLILAIGSGCLGAMVKVTTMAIVILPAVLITLAGVRTWGVDLKDLSSLRAIGNIVSKHRLAVLSLIAIALLPLVAAASWTLFTDGIKETSIYTRWLTSAALQTWTYGTLAQKLSLANWLAWLARIRFYFLLGWMWLLPLLALPSLLWLAPRYRLVFAASIAGALLTIFIFFNLFQHDYYYIAISAYMSVVAGFGIYAAVRYLRPSRWWLVLPVGILFALILRDGISQYLGFRAQIPFDLNPENVKWAQLADRVSAITPQDAGIIAFQREWYPNFVLLTGRKALVIAPRAEPLFTCDSIANYPYATVVVVDPPERPDALDVVLKCFAIVRQDGPGLYSVPLTAPP